MTNTARALGPFARTNEWLNGWKNDAPLGVFPSKNASASGCFGGVFTHFPNRPTSQYRASYTPKAAR